jgi:hypothetical protein
MKKPRLSVYLDPATLAQLTERAERKAQPKSLVAEAAITSFLTSDDADQREAAFVRRLDLLTRQGERLERDITVAAEALALFIRLWLNVTPPLPDSAQPTAQAKGRERFEAFMDALGRRLSKGQTLLREVSIDRHNDGAARQSETTTTVQSPSNEV